MIREFVTLMIFAPSAVRHPEDDENSSKHVAVLAIYKILLINVCCALVLDNKTVQDARYMYPNTNIFFLIITNSCTHSIIFIKNTMKAHVKFTSTCFGTQMEPSSGGQHLILAKVYIWFNGASLYSQYCGGYAATILTIWTSSIEPYVYFS